MTPKQERFVEEYLIDLNATQAAIRAGYSERSAEVTGHETLKNPKVAAAIQEAKDKRSEATGVDAYWLLSRLAEEAKADIADIYADSGELLPIKEWPLIWRQGLVSGIDVQQVKGEDGQEYGVINKIKVSDRVKRLELIGKHVDVKAFLEKSVDVTVNQSEERPSDMDLARRVAYLLTNAVERESLH